MVRPWTASSNKRGFTLLEVIIAFVIMALILGATFETFSIGFRQAALTGHYAGAVVRAESQLALIGLTEPLAVGVNTGRFEQFYTWRTEITPVLAEDPEAPETPETPEAPEKSPFQLYNVVVSVFWGEDGNTRDVTLRSLRLGMLEKP